MQVRKGLAEQGKAAQINVLPASAVQFTQENSLAFDVSAIRLAITVIILAIAAAVEGSRVLAAERVPLIHQPVAIIVNLVVANLCG